MAIKLYHLRQRKKSACAINFTVRTKHVGWVVDKTNVRSFVFRALLSHAFNSLSLCFSPSFPFAKANECIRPVIMLSPLVWIQISSVNYDWHRMTQHNFSPANRANTSMATRKRKTGQTVVFHSRPTRRQKYVMTREICIGVGKKNLHCLRANHDLNGR